MLSRVANNFYWMGRYIERASTIARLLLVQISEMPEDSSDFVSASWKGIFDSFKLSDLKKSFLPEPKGEKSVSDDFLLADAYTLTDYFTFETHHPVSIYSCFKWARENAIQNQDIARSIGLSIHKTYLKLEKTSLKELWPDKMADFYKNILEFSWLFHGLIKDRLYQGLAFHFIHLGIYLERLQNQASIFENHIRLMIQHKEEEEDVISLLLRLSALESYRQIHSLDLTLPKVADFLIYAQFPHSLKFAEEQIRKSLSSIEGIEDPNALPFPSLNKIESQLRASYVGQALPKFLNSFYKNAIAVGESISKIYFHQEKIGEGPQEQFPHLFSKKKK